MALALDGRRLPWQKPVCPVRIKWTHSLAQGLTFYVLHGHPNSSGYPLETDLVANKRSNSSALNQNFLDTAAGYGTYCPAVVAGQAIIKFGYPGTTTSNGSGTGDFSMACGFVMHNTSLASDINIFGQGGPAAFNDAGIAVRATTLKLTGYRNGVHSGDSAKAVVPEQPACGVFTRAGSTLQLYLDGEPTTTGTQSGNISTGSAVYYKAYPQAGNTASGGDIGVLTFLWSAMWNRALSATEAVTLSNDPYSLLGFGL